MAKTFHFATWAHNLSYFGGSPEEVEGHVRRLADAGFELIIPCVKNPPGYADFKTDVAEINPSYPDWDPLRVLSESATEHNMKVHAWLCVFLEGDHSALLNRSPHLAAEFEPSLAAEFESIDERWGCACRPEVQEYELALYESVADGYPIHGLHLDYNRTGGVCRCDYCRKQMAYRGINVDRISGSRDPGFVEWTDWRCERVTSFVEQVRELTRLKGIELSAAVFKDFPSCRDSNGQDWVSWAEKSLVDFIFPMNYDKSTRNVRLRTRQHVALVGGGCRVWEGLSKNIWVGLGESGSSSQFTTTAMVEQVRAAQQEGAEGVVLFCNPSLSDEDLAAIESLQI